MELGQIKIMASHTGKKRQLATSRIVRTHSVGITNHLDVCGSEMVPLLCEGPMPTNEEVRSAEVAPAVSLPRPIGASIPNSKKASNASRSKISPFRTVRHLASS